MRVAASNPRIVTKLMVNSNIYFLFYQNCFQYFKTVVVTLTLLKYTATPFPCILLAEYTPILVDLQGDKSSLKLSTFLPLINPVIKFPSVKNDKYIIKDNA